jgi:ferritin-like metal-binding protein YciE
VTYLKDVHSIEGQALRQMQAAPKIAGEPSLTAAFEQHLAETEDHERLIRERLEAHDASPSMVKEAIMRAGAEAFVLFARSQPDTPGKLAAHAFSYEHLEAAAYELLRLLAERAGEGETAAVARQILLEERAMARRLEECFPGAVEASLDGASGADLERRLTHYLADAHAIEMQSEKLLERGPKIAGVQQLAAALEEHLEQTRRHAHLLEARLGAHDSSPSTLKDAAMRLGALNWGAFFAAQPDTPAKLAAFAYAFEHLEIAGLQELALVARHAGDSDTVAIAEEILEEERQAAGRLAATFDAALDGSLRAEGIAA